MKRYPILFVLQGYHLEKITKKLAYTDHASRRIKERYTTSDTVLKAIRQADFAYVAGDGIINVGLHDGTVFKIAQDSTKYTVITYLETSISSTSLRRKYRLACRGHNR